MDDRFRRHLRPIAAIVLVFFSLYCVEPLNFAHAAQAKPQPFPSETIQTSAEIFEEALRSSKELIERIDQALADGKDITIDIKTLTGYRQSMEAADKEIRAEFKATESKLKAAKLPAEILERHKKAVSEYDANVKQLQQNLQGIEQLENERKDAKNKKNLSMMSAKEKGLKQRVKDAMMHLKKTVKERRHTPLDPNNLPHRTPKMKERKPRMKKEQFNDVVGANGRSPILLAFNGDPSTLILAQANPDLPTPQDLTETIEVQFTQEIRDLAASLDNNPVKIYNYVRNNIDFVPTYGSIQGANHCLLTKQCNDMDTASLLIALLRTSGISARYVMGTIEVPIDKVMNWVGGFTDERAALNFIGSGGTPVSGLISGGRIIAARMEHVWVEAYVDYIPSRGAVYKQGDTWIPLDASFKQFTFTEGVDLKTAVPFDTQAFVNQLQSTATIDPVTGSVTKVDAAFIQATMTDLQTRLQAAFPNSTVDQLVGKKTIVANTLPFLAGSLPYKHIVIGSRTSGLADSIRHKITFEVADNIFFGAELTYTARLPELAGKRISLRYSPATEADKTTLLSFKDAITVPAYLVTMKPELLVEGVVKATGESITMGKDETFSMTFLVPGGSTERIENVVTAGAYTAIGLDLGVVSEAVVQKRVDNLTVTQGRFAAGDLTAISLDDVQGESLTAQALIYFLELDIFTNIIKKQQGVITARLPSEGLMAQQVQVATLFGIPVSASAGAPSIDVDRDLQVVLAKDGDAAKVAQYFQVSGPLASGLEHGIFEQIYGGEGISAVKALSIANSQGIPIYQVTSANVSAVLPQLAFSASVKTDIANAVAAGKVVTVSQREISFNGWNGVGYTVIDPVTGAGGYIISGGLAGGGLLKLIIDFMAWLLSPSEASAETVEGQKNQTSEVVHALDKAFHFLKELAAAIGILYVAVRLLAGLGSVIVGSAGLLTSLFVGIVIVVAAAFLIATLVLLIRTVFLTWRKKNAEFLYFAYNRGPFLLSANHVFCPLFKMA